ncbi:MAG: hypothetical protein ACK4YQ_07425 [Phenylobacterium sp.]|uniref:hypothetical protein n=1 Tax=Phenylobacterium sp. TaxID=1871053 RepID=UPI0039192878
MKRRHDPAMWAALVLLAGAAAAPVQAQAPLTQNPPRETIVCLDVSGRSLPAVCKVPGDRLDVREDFCLCPEGRRVKAPVCGPGQTPPAESRAFERARRTAAEDGTLIGDLYEGRPMCVAPRGP